jgi:hypothetical protein
MAVRVLAGAVDYHPFDDPLGGHRRAAGEGHRGAAVELLVAEAPDGARGRCAVRFVSVLPGR